MEMLKRSRKVRRSEEGQRKVRGLSVVSTSSVTWLALMAICSTVMSAMLLLSCLEAPPVAPSSIFCGLKEMNAQVKGQIACPPMKTQRVRTLPVMASFPRSFFWYSPSSTTLNSCRASGWMVPHDVGSQQDRCSMQSQIRISES